MWLQGALCVRRPAGLFHHIQCAISELQGGQTQAGARERACSRHLRRMHTRPPAHTALCCMAAARSFWFLPILFCHLKDNRTFMSLNSSGSTGDSVSSSARHVPVRAICRLPFAIQFGVTLEVSQRSEPPSPSGPELGWWPPHWVDWDGRSASEGPWLAQHQGPAPCNPTLAAPLVAPSFLLACWLLGCRHRAFPSTPSSTLSPATLLPLPTHPGR